MDILILDHHESEEKNPYALIVNNQMSDNYSNKDFAEQALYINSYRH